LKKVMNDHFTKRNFPSLFQVFQMTNIPTPIFQSLIAIHLHTDDYPHLPHVLHINF
jgi:hypothetical protein